MKSFYKLNESLVRILTKEWNNSKNKDQCEMAIPYQYIGTFNKISNKYPLQKGKWVFMEDEDCKLIQSNFIKAKIINI